MESNPPLLSAPAPARAVSVGPDVYAESCDRALEGLFRPCTESGFWSDEEGRILPRLDFDLGPDDRPRWRPNALDLHRYAPVALMGVMSWRTGEHGHDAYDAKLQRNLAHYDRLVRDPAVRATLPSYGAGALVFTFARAHALWPDRGFDGSAGTLADFALGHYRFRFNEDALVLMGVAACLAFDPDRYRPLLTARADAMRAGQDEQGLYRWREESGCFRHQNQMYTIWGLAHADLALGRTDAAASIRRCLDYTVRRRMQDDGALLWHHYRNPAHRLYALVRGRLDRSYMPEHRCLFSCHQAFFVYAALMYRRLERDRVFDEPVERAMRWLYGENVRGANMWDLSGIALPWRIMTTDGQTVVPRHHFLKAYEIGAMILALVALLEDTKDAS